jgi:hypothetical protein
MHMRVLVASLTALLLSHASPAQDKKPAVDETLVGEWKVSLELDSERPNRLGSTTFARFRVAKDGACELFGTTDSIATEYRHRDFALIGTLSTANDEGVMDLDLSYQNRLEQDQPIGPVVYKCIAKLDGNVLIVALGRARSDSRPKAFGDLTTAARASSTDEEKSPPPVTVLVLGTERK